jgi:peptidoglycan/LPS O-acetylase OafA/YrhL
MADATIAPTRPRRDATPNLSEVPYLPGLDGMRALAVVAVMIYHANPAWLGGGFLGVEVFFVISGYLITLLLMSEHERTGGINLTDFWIRRGRRLLPALFLMLFLLLTYTWIFRWDELGKLRGDLLSSVFYVTNWYQIWVGQGYAAANDFVPLRHLWSLAVEEQFYLVWPIVMLLILRRTGTRRLARVAAVLTGIALAVTIATAVLYHRGRIGECSVTPGAYWSIDGRCIDKANALYLSTITRSSGLLLGAAFAMVWRPVAIMRGPLRRANRALDVVGVVGLLVLAFLHWRLDFLTTDGADPWLFRGGFLWTAIATLMVIAAVTHRRTLVSRGLANRALLWIGTRSYGLYLFHWPIYQIIREVAGNVLTVTEFVVAMAITIVITEASYTLVETPIRRREFGLRWRSWTRGLDPLSRLVVRNAVFGLAVLVVLGSLFLSLADVRLNEVEQASADNQDAITSFDELLGGGDASAAPPEVATTTVPAVSPVTEPDATTTTSTTTTTTTTLPAEPVDYLAIGDSVMLGAANVLSDRGYVVNAEQSRQMADMVPLFEQLGEAELFGDPVVIHLGTNGPITRETLDALLAPLSRVPNVIMLNVRANRAWTAENNAILAARDNPNDNIILIDWATKSNECPGSCFAADGIHLTAAGSQFYADLIGDWTGR